MQTTKVTIDKIDYTIRRADFGIDNQILDAGSYLELGTGRMMIKTGSRRHMTIKLCVTSPTLSDDQIQKMTPEHGAKLFNAIEQFRREASLPLEPSRKSSSDTRDSGLQTEG